MTTIEQAIHLRQSGQLDQARELLLELIEMKPLNPEARYQCAWVHDVMERDKLDKVWN
ncbi:hypothetical protein [Cohnella sp. AR92]|uniref:hypothetical protein n=1 Tax=Cohnella sp. AR92 TaxID=648716 RepID=UPI0013158D41|nr:hypothetical protein [Cohnella sp. AR92]